MKKGAQGNRKQKGHLNATEQVVRDAYICQFKIEGLTWREIAAKPEVKGLSVTACQDVYRAYLNDPARGLAIENVRQIIVEASEKYVALEERMGGLWHRQMKLIEGKRDENEDGQVPESERASVSNLIGLTRTQADMIDRRVRLLQASSILPNEIGTIRHIEDVKEIMSTLVRILDEEGVPERVFERLMDELPLVPARS